MWSMDPFRTLKLPPKKLQEATLDTEVTFEGMTSQHVCWRGGMRGAPSIIIELVEVFVFEF